MRGPSRLWYLKTKRVLRAPVQTTQPVTPSPPVDLTVLLTEAGEQLLTEGGDPLQQE